jgi:hypothetical protein
MCRKELAANAKESVAAFRERIGSYPCGSVSPMTKLFKIARTSEETQEVLRAFEMKVAQEMEEALAQALEIVLTPDLQTLSSSLSRRVEFWEKEIEDNWTVWTTQSQIFHDACEGVAETWCIFQADVRELLAWLSDDTNSPSQATLPIAFVLPLIDVKDVRQHKIWEELYQVLIEVTVVIAKLGAWTLYHNLRGDGVTLQEAKDLLEAILNCLDTTFDSRFEKFSGRDAVFDRLAVDDMWNLVAPAMEGVSTDDSSMWWAPERWPPRAVRLVDVSTLACAPKKQRDCSDMFWGASSEHPGIEDSSLAESILSTRHVNSSGSRDGGVPERHQVQQTRASSSIAAASECRSSREPVETSMSSTKTQERIEEQILETSASFDSSAAVIGDEIPPVTVIVKDGLIENCENTAVLGASSGDRSSPVSPSGKSGGLPQKWPRIEVA